MSAQTTRQSASRPERAQARGDGVHPGAKAAARAIATFLIVGVALLAGCAHPGTGVPVNVVTWRAGLTSSGQPGRAYLNRVKELGYGAVINLAPPDSFGSIRDEGALVTDQGVDYVAMPVDFDHPTIDDFKRFSTAMQQHANGNVLVHCRVDFRASTFVFLYRVIHENAPPDQAVALLTGVWVPNATWTRFAQETLAVYGKSAEIL